MRALSLPSWGDHGRITYLDGWRGAAIGFVLVAHYSFVESFNFGRLGVELFFVLSGRLMAQILFEKSAEIRPFLFRRFSRVYPAFAFFIMCMGLIEALTGKLKLTVLDLLSSLTFTYNYYQLWVGRPGVLEHIWSLCIEEHTYFLLALVAFLQRRVGFSVSLVLGLIAGACVISGAIQSHLGYDYYAVYWRSDVRASSIIIGALAYLNRDALSRVVTPLVFVALAVGAFLLNFAWIPDAIKYSLGTASLAIVLVSLVDSKSRLRSALSNSTLVTLGTFSYSIYLWQQPFTKLSHGLTAKLVGLIVLFTISVASFYFIERPARKSLNKRFGTQPDSLVKSNTSIKR